MVPIDRRALLAGFAGLAGSLALAHRLPLAANGQGLWLNAYATDAADPRFGVAGFDSSGQVRFHVVLPGRAHAVIPHPNGREAVVLARRPGTWIGLIDLDSGAVKSVWDVPADRRGTGHAVFSHDGRRLYVPEDDVPHETGVVSILDPFDGYRRVGERPGHGLGPHEALLLNDGALVLANGGVLTHPDTGRVKLNIDTMEPSLTYVDAGNGTLLDKVRLADDMRNLGIRHIAATDDGRIAFGMQDEQPDGTVQPLVGIHRRGQAPVLLSAPDDAWLRFRGYIGSLASDGRFVAATSPKGGVAGFWDLDPDGPPEGRWIGMITLRDVCAVAAKPGDGFILTSGLGIIATATGANSRQIVENPGYRWDNHVARFDKA